MQTLNSKVTHLNSGNAGVGWFLYCRTYFQNPTNRSGTLSASEGINVQCFPDVFVSEHFRREYLTLPEGTLLEKLHQWSPRLAMHLGIGAECLHGLGSSLGNPTHPVHRPAHEGDCVGGSSVLLPGGSHIDATF